MKVELKLKPFQTPNFVSVDMPPRSRAEGFTPLPSLALHELSPETLAEMCDEFRKEVFAKAMANDPAKDTTP